MSQQPMKYWVQEVMLQVIPETVLGQPSVQYVPVYLAADVEALVQANTEAMEMYIEVNGKYHACKDALAAKEAVVERLRTMSTVEMMCENESVNQHVREWEVRCLNAEAELTRYKNIPVEPVVTIEADGRVTVPVEALQAYLHQRDTLQAELDRYQTAIRQGLWGDTIPDEPHGKEIFVIRREVVKLYAELARVREALREALVIMRNYYGHAISRAAVEEFITKAQQHIQPSRGEQG